MYKIVDNTERTCYEVIWDLISNGHQRTPEQLLASCAALASDYSVANHNAACDKLIAENKISKFFNAAGHVQTHPQHLVNSAQRAVEYDDMVRTGLIAQHISTFGNTNESGMTSQEFLCVVMLIVCLIVVGFVQFN